MIKLATTSQVRDIEKAADENGTSYSEMMQRAGRATADRILTYLEGLKDPRVLILTGPGNNGGDGLVTGLFIAQDLPEADVRFYLLKARPDDDPLMPMAESAGLFSAISEHDHDKRLLRNMVASADVVVDALLGIGVKLPLRGDVSRILRTVSQALNERASARPESYIVDASKPQQIKRVPPIRVIAVDVPSGLDANSGEADAATLTADETITFIAAKPGLFTFPGARHAGLVTVANLGLPAKLKQLNKISDFVPDADYVSGLLPEREADSNKGTHGKALVVAGSVNYMGAPALAAEAAYRSGAGLVTVAAPRPVASALAIQQKEPTWLLLPHDMGVIAQAAGDVLRQEMSDYQALLIGPGITTEKSTQDFLEDLLTTRQDMEGKAARKKLGFQIAAKNSAEAVTDKAKTLPPLVLDADALNILSKLRLSPADLPENTILTPHPGEMARLCEMEVSDVQSDRMELSRKKAKAWRCVLVLKGAHTVIAAPKGQIAVLPFKNPALATAGTGDVLAGMITGLLAQGLEPFDAAVAGVYLHGLAGQMASGGDPEAILAGDILPMIRHALIALRR